MYLKLDRRLLLAAVCILMAGVAWPENAPSPKTLTPAQTLTSTQIVQQIELHHDQLRPDGSAVYHALRHYTVEYQGFSKTVAGQMDVEVDYSPATGKKLRIVSQSGSKFLCDKVLKKAVDSETEASQDAPATALTPANYKFQLLGSETVAGRLAYVLDVEPVTPSKFLYRGKIWVDAADFAVAKMETEPAKSPSIWISRTQIHYTSAMTDGHWLPQAIRSETKVRIGGTAVLSIDYGTYRIVSDAPLLAKGE